MKPSPAAFDVLIIGAGPGGTAAAIRAARHGLRVGLIERRGFPRDVPGEALHPDVDRLFDELDVTDAVSAAGFIRYPGWILHQSGTPTFMPFAGRSSLRFGYQAWRATLDEILLRRARREGAVVLQPAAVTDVLLSGGCVIGLRGGTQLWRSRYVVDASGASMWLSRRLGLEVKRLSPKLVARYAYSRKASALGVIPEFHEHASGWTWLARVRADCCQCVSLPLGSETTPTLAPPFDRMDGARGADVTWRLVPECAGDGYFLCGEAAATLDPAAPGGVARALSAGIKAADRIAAIESGAVSASKAASDYRGWLARKVVTEAIRLAARYRGLQRPPSWLDETILLCRTLVPSLRMPRSNALESLPT